MLTVLEATLVGVGGACRGLPCTMREHRGMAKRGEQEVEEGGQAPAYELLGGSSDEEGRNKKKRKRGDKKRKDKRHKRWVGGALEPVPAFVFHLSPAFFCSLSRIQLPFPACTFCAGPLKPAAGRQAALTAPVLGHKLPRPSLHSSPQFHCT